MSSLGDFFYLQQSFGKTRNSPSHAAFAYSYSLRLAILGRFYCCLKKKKNMIIYCTYKGGVEKLVRIKSVSPLLPVRNGYNHFYTNSTKLHYSCTLCMMYMYR